MWTRDRVAVAAYFAVLGVVCSAWVSSIDDLKLMLGLNEAELGWLLFCGPFGNLISFTFVGRLVGRLGSRRSTILAAPLYLAASAGLALCFLLKAPVPYWCVALACFGGFGNITNISINTQAGIIEKRCGRNIMSSFHAMFSLFFLFGVLLAMALAPWNVPVGLRALTAIGLSAAAHLWAVRHLPVGGDAPSEKKGGALHWPDRSLLAVGLAGIVIMGCEGAVNDWVNVFFVENFAQQGIDADGLRKIGLVSFTIAMVAGRFYANNLLNRLSTAVVFRLYVILSCIGLGVSLSSPFAYLSATAFIVLASAGFALAGFGLSGLVPILYSKANRTRSMPAASAITFVGTMGFLGYFFGPPLMGFISHLSNLSVALGLFAVLMLLCLFLNPDRQE